MNNLRKNMVIDGILASEAIDTSGEILDVDGCDISDLQNGTGVLNFEHKGDDPMGILGKIIYAKKIKHIDDYSNERERAYWSQIKIPFIYGQAELFDGENHPGAVAAAAIIRYYHKRREPLLARFSIEGTTLERKGNVLKRSVARKIALTLKPCNRSCYSGVLRDDTDLQRSEKNPSKEIFRGGFCEVDLLVVDPVERLANALDHLKDLGELRKAAAQEKAGRFLEHYSPLSNLDVIDPKFHGTGMRDAATKRKQTDPSTWVDRSYYYEAGTEPEQHFAGQHKYRVQLPNDAKILDLANETPEFFQRFIDPGTHVVNQNKLEQHIRDKGFWGYKHSGSGVPNVVAMFHPLKPLRTDDPMAKTITAGGVGVAPSQLTGGAALQREDIVGSEYKRNKNRLLASFRDWDRVTPIRKFLKFRLPDASDHYIDRFAKLVDDYQVKKSQRLFMNLEKALKTSCAVALMETLSKRIATSKSLDDGVYRVYMKDSPRQVARFALRDNSFEALEDHRRCFGDDCADGPLGPQHLKAVEALRDSGHSFVHEDAADFVDPEQAEFYQIVVPETEDTIVVKVANNKMMTMDGTEIPERNVNAILDAVTGGSLGMSPLAPDDVPQEATEPEDEFASGSPDTTSEQPDDSEEVDYDAIAPSERELAVHGDEDHDHWSIDDIANFDEINAPYGEPAVDEAAPRDDKEEELK